MNKQTKENILQFLNRTELKGYEVPAFNQCISELLAEENLQEKGVENNEDQEDFQDQESDEEELEEHTDKEINKKKKAITSILDEVDGL